MNKTADLLNRVCSCSRVTLSSSQDVLVNEDEEGEFLAVVPLEAGGTLEDDGRNADRTRGDGIYSG